ncbi:protein disulfide-isomerase A5 [Folsomia candida]|uniref:protein disulfide-isomerase A5 n=1 Tax=Folsomia candida TaxID=158441 RepID=UPI000B9099AD|nr:protein disulfide-isomerase A5 [Folsomia candida]
MQMHTHGYFHPGRKTFSLFVVTTTFLLTLLYRVPSSLGDEQLSSNRIGSQKNKVVLNEMTDVKEWKRLIKSKTNVLICFGSGRASFARDDILGVLKEAAGVVKGLGTIALVDCASSGDAKKLCKKVKASPSPGNYVMKHYNNGEFNKDYDRAPRVSSVVNFLKDPTGDLPWHEDETATAVVHLPNLQALQKLIKKESWSRGVMVLYYTPWCGFCKKIKPDYVAAAEELKEEDGILAAIDVNMPENGPVRQKYNITGFPTLLYFRNGQMKQQFEGENNKEGIISFMRDPSAPKVEKPKDAEWSDEPSEVVHLTTSTFDTTIKENPSVLVMFYAPWCGHCKKMKPGYVVAAEKLKKQKIVGVLAAVDVTKESSLGTRYDIKGYPTVKYFKDGELAFDVGNVRDESAIIDFMKNPKEPPPPPPPEKAWSEEESAVIHLNEENFKSTLRKKKRALVMFYAPWCGHCKNAKPSLTAAAEELKDDPRVMYGAVDCTVEKSLCETYEVRGFPTFKIFQYFNKEDVLNYDGERTKSGFLSELKRSGSPSPNSETAQEDDWSENPGYEKVNILTDSTIEKYFSTHESSLVMFYTTSDKTAKPDFAQAAAILDREGIGALAAVDCSVSEKTCQRYKVSGYPTFQYFKNGKFSSDYNDPRKAQDFIRFMKIKANEREEL